MSHLPTGPFLLMISTAHVKLFPGWMNAVASPSQSLTQKRAPLVRSTQVSGSRSPTCNSLHVTHHCMLSVAGWKMASSTHMLRSLCSPIRTTTPSKQKQVIPNHYPAFFDSVLQEPSLRDQLRNQRRSKQNHLLLRWPSGDHPVMKMQWRLTAHQLRMPLA